MVGGFQSGFGNSLGYLVKSADFAAAANWSYLVPPFMSRAIGRTIEFGTHGGLDEFSDLFLEDSAWWATLLIARAENRVVATFRDSKHTMVLRLRSGELLPLHHLSDRLQHLTRAHVQRDALRHAISGWLLPPLGGNGDAPPPNVEMILPDNVQALASDKLVQAALRARIVSNATDAYDSSSGGRDSSRACSIPNNSSTQMIAYATAQGPFCATNGGIGARTWHETKTRQKHLLIARRILNSSGTTAWTRTQHLVRRCDVVVLEHSHDMQLSYRFERSAPMFRWGYHRRLPSRLQTGSASADVEALLRDNRLNGGARAVLRLDAVHNASALMRAEHERVLTMAVHVRLGDVANIGVPASDGGRGNGWSLKRIGPPLIAFAFEVVSEYLSSRRLGWVIDVAIVTDSPHLKQVKHLVDYLTALGEKSRTIRRVLVPHLSMVHSFDLLIGADLLVVGLSSFGLSAAALSRGAAFALDPPQKRVDAFEFTLNDSRVIHVPWDQRFHLWDNETDTAFVPRVTRARVAQRFEEEFDQRVRLPLQFGVI